MTFNPIKIIVAFVVFLAWVFLAFLLMGCSSTSQMGYLNKNDKDFSNSKLIIGIRSYEDMNKSYGEPR
jgi:uncharacterized protein YcfL